jgi:hypothetical protein
MSFYRCFLKCPVYGVPVLLLVNLYAFLSENIKYYPFKKMASLLLTRNIAAFETFNSRILYVSSISSLFSILLVAYRKNGAKFYSNEATMFVFNLESSGSLLYIKLVVPLEIVPLPTRSTFLSLIF